MHKNPTIFNWETVEQFKISNQNYDKTASIHKAKLITGDFNGDGKTDFLAIPENKDAGWTGRKFFVSHGTYFTKAFEGQWKNDGEVKQVVCGDFNGDGTTDIAIKRYCNNIAYNCDLYLSFRKSDGSFYLQLKDIISLPKDYELQPIDVNGDGAMDLFLWNKGKKDYRVLASYPNSNGTIKPLGGTSTGQCEEQFYRVEFADINGDGLIDVLNLTDTGTLVLQSNGFSSFIKKIRYYGLPKNTALPLAISMVMARATCFLLLGKMIQTKMDGHNGAYYFQRETEPLKNLCTQDGRCP